uniref:Uncharacterized protein n=1 Tax=viral metagenome TaxID=1070528 RepID=A0A6C0JC33_9ZZZZ
MHIFQPSREELDEDFKTSFTFDNDDEKASFSEWLNNMEIDFIRAKIPVVVDGVMKQQTCIVINNESQNESGEEDSNNHETNNEPDQISIVVDEQPKKKKKKVKSDVDLNI